MGEFLGNQHTESEYDEYTDEELVDDVAALAAELGEAPTTDDADRADEMPSLATLYNVIDDDWMTVLRDAGIRPTKHQRRSTPTDRRERMLADLRKTNRETDNEEFRLRQYDEHGSFTSSSMKERFGSWSQACERAGIDCGTRHGVQCTGPQRTGSIASTNEWSRCFSMIVASGMKSIQTSRVCHPNRTSIYQRLIAGSG